MRRNRKRSRARGAGAEEGCFPELLASSDFQGRAFVSSSSEWRTCGPRLQVHCRAHKDERWLLLDAEDRQRAFNDFVEQLKDAETAHKEEKRKKRCDAFRGLLDEEVSKSSSEAYADLKWSSIDSLLRPKGDARYKDLSSDSRRRTFLDWRDEKIVALGGEPPAREKSRSRSRERSRRERSRRSRCGTGRADRRGGGTGPGTIAPGPAAAGGCAVLRCPWR